MQDQFYQKRVLIPFWTIRLGLMLILLGLYSWALVVLTNLNLDDTSDVLGDGTYEDDQEFQSAKNAAIGVVAGLIALLTICALLDVVAIILFARRRLRPLVFLIFNVLQTTLWLALLILNIIGTTVTHGAGIIFNIIVFLLYLGLLIYASIMYHRFRRGGNRGVYQQAPNPGHYAPQSHDFQYQPYTPQPNYAKGNVQSHAAEYNTGVHEPQTYYNQSMPQGGVAYEMPVTGARYA